MRGIVLAGGLGTRLRPSTLAISKHLFTIYDKPMIYYPLATLMAAGVREILIIADSYNLPLYKKLLQDGRQLGMKFTYAVQKKPTGIVDAFLIGKEFIGKSDCSLILGDNLFHGTGLGRQLMEIDTKSNCQIFAHRVANPSQYGVVKFNSKGKVIKIIEKPKKFVSNFAVPGLYFFPNNVLRFAQEINLSRRGEREITTLLNLYLARGELNVSILPRGTAWLDTGSFDSLHDASSYVRIIEERQGFKIACIEEIAWRQNWITTQQLSKISKTLQPSPYGSYLRKLISDKENKDW